MKINKNWIWLIVIILTSLNKMSYPNKKKRLYNF